MGLDAPFLADLPLTLSALDFAVERHAGQQRDADGAPFILHPLEVAVLLQNYGYDDEVVAAGAPPRPIENTDTTPDELLDRFGNGVVLARRGAERGRVDRGLRGAQGGAAREGGRRRRGGAGDLRRRQGLQGARAARQAHPRSRAAATSRRQPPPRALRGEPRAAERPPAGPPPRAASCSSSSGRCDALPPGAELERPSTADSSGRPASVRCGRSVKARGCAAEERGRVMAPGFLQSTGPTRSSPPAIVRRAVVCALPRVSPARACSPSASAPAIVQSAAQDADTAAPGEDAVGAPGARRDARRAAGRRVARRDEHRDLDRAPLPSLPPASAAAPAPAEPAARPEAPRRGRPPPPRPRPLRRGGARARGQAGQGRSGRRRATGATRTTEEECPRRRGRLRGRRPRRRRSLPRTASSPSRATAAPSRAQGRAATTTATSSRKRVSRKPTEAPLRTAGGVPTNSNPTLSVAVPGAALIGVPNFFIDKFRIPPFLLPIYQAAGIEYGVRWEVLAAINEIETDYGRNLNVSSAGALGWMQFMPATWKAYGVDANGDGRKDPYNPVDAIFAAARYLKAAGARRGPAPRDLRLQPRRLVRRVGPDARPPRRRHADRPRRLAHRPDPGPLPARRQGPLRRRPRPSAQANKEIAAGDNAAVPVDADEDRRGILIFAKPGTAAVATHDGKVVARGSDKRLGRYVKVRDPSATRTRTRAWPGSRPPTPCRSTAPRRRPPSRATPTSDDRRRAARRHRPAIAGGKERLFADAAPPRRPSRPAARTRSARPVPQGKDEYVEDLLHLAPDQVTWKRLKPGATIVAGTVLGRVGDTASTRSPHVLFEIRPAGRGAPRIDPKPILDGWKLLESTAIYRAKKRNPFFGEDAEGADDRPDPAHEQGGAASAASSPTRASTSTRAAASDVRAGIVDRRVLALLEFLAANGLRPGVTSLQCGHGYITASGNVSHHSTGTAVDIATINGIPIMGHQGEGSVTDITIRRLLTLQGAMKPRPDHQPHDVPGRGQHVAMGDHADHIHVGYRPVGGDPKTGSGRQVRRRDPQARPVAASSSTASARSRTRSCRRSRRRRRSRSRPSATATPGAAPRTTSVLRRCGALPLRAPRRPRRGLRRRRRCRPASRRSRSTFAAARSAGRCTTRSLVPSDAGERPPLLILLHGRGEDGPDKMASAEVGERAGAGGLARAGRAVARRRRVVVLARPRLGDWGRMVVDELIPAAAEEFGADPRRVAIGGISMGGFGALHLAALHPERFCAVGGAFARGVRGGGRDGAGRVRRRRGLRRDRPPRRGRSRSPQGRGSTSATRTRSRPPCASWSKRMRSPDWHPWPGGHDSDYWDAHTQEWMRFYIRSLARCRGG